METNLKIKCDSGLLTENFLQIFSGRAYGEATNAGQSVGGGGAYLKGSVYPFSFCLFLFAKKKNLLLVSL
ncbi:hypothetical protein B0188_08635 [[Haemophilus] felis]|uniref:Uncharacterized protein n=1 Tax=[Haemophilus] felis TaxID=123822 RepID=A0A1T0AXG0_9PAST|nr:hypothetical protein B0188_08635 [[Haemophilus] felis]